MQAWKAEMGSAHCLPAKRERDPRRAELIRQREEAESKHREGSKLV